MPGDLGDLCYFDFQCMISFNCINNQCVEPIAPGSEGSDCAMTEDCNSGLLCIDELCSLPRAEGETCGEDEQCIEGFECIFGTCSRLSLLGEACEATPDCEGELVCRDNICNEPLGEFGDECEEDINCGSGL